MKVPKKISAIISSVKKHKIPGFIYNLSEELLQQIIADNKKAIVVDGAGIRTKWHLINAAATALGIDCKNIHRVDSPLIVNIQQRIGMRLIIIIKPEYFGYSTYEQITEFKNIQIPVIVLSSYPNFIQRFRETKYYQENMIIEFDYNDLK